MAMKLAIVTVLKKYEVTPGEKTDIPLKFPKAGFFLTTEDGTVHLKLKLAEWTISVYIIYTISFQIFRVTL